MDGNAEFDPETDTLFGKLGGGYLLIFGGDFHRRSFCADLKLVLGIVQFITLRGIDFLIGVTWKSPTPPTKRPVSSTKSNINLALLVGKKGFLVPLASDDE